MVGTTTFWADLAPRKHFVERPWFVSRYKILDSQPVILGQEQKSNTFGRPPGNAVDNQAAAGGLGYIHCLGDVLIGRRDAVGIVANNMWPAGSSRVIRRLGRMKPRIGFRYQTANAFPAGQLLPNNAQMIWPHRHAVIMQVLTLRFADDASNTRCEPSRQWAIVIWLRATSFTASTVSDIPRNFLCLRRSIFSDLTHA